MRKLTVAAGILLLATLFFATPSKADSVTYELTGHGFDVTFTLQQGSTPAANFGNYIEFLNVPGTVVAGSPVDYTQVNLGLSGYLGVTDYWAFGSTGPTVAIYAPGLYTVNSDGSVTLNSGTWNLGDFHVFYGGTTYDYPLTVTVIPTASTPEPASLALLGVGALALMGIRRRKVA